MLKIQFLSLSRKMEQFHGYFIEWECSADLSADTIEARWLVVASSVSQSTRNGGGDQGRVKPFPEHQPATQTRSFPVPAGFDDQVHSCPTHRKARFPQL